MTHWNRELIYSDEKLDMESRKRTGSFYTPMSIARFMVTSALQWWLRGSSASLHTIINLEVADLSAGSGIFMLAWLELIEDKIREEYPSISEHELSALIESALGRVHLVDISVTALDMFRRSVIERWNIDPAMNLYVMNALSDECPKELPRMDIILGNPPYIGEKNNLDVFDAIRDQLIFTEHYQAKMDYHHFFIYRGIAMLKPGGILSYLIPDYFVTSDGASRLRRFLMERTDILGFLDFQSMSLFDSAKGHHSSILTLSGKETKQMDKKVFVMKPHGDRVVEEVLKEYLEVQMRGSDSSIASTGNAQWFWMPSDELSVHSDYLSFERAEVTGFFKRMYETCPYVLDDIYDVNQGIVSGCDRLKTGGEDSGVFVLTWDEAEALSIERDLLRPFYKNSHIGHFSLHETSVSPWCIIYIDDWIQDFELKYPYTYTHLRRFKDKLSSRRECKSGTRPWYGLQWPRRKEIFERWKIVAPQRARSNRFSLVEKAFYASADVYYLAPKERLEKHDQALESYIIFDPLVLTGILNSSLGYFFLSHGGKKKGELLELYATPLKKIPVSKPDIDAINNIRHITSRLMMTTNHGTKDITSLRYDEEIHVLNEAVSLLYGLTDEEADMVESYWKEWSR